MNKISAYRILIADDEPIESTALELLLKNTFQGIEILPSVSNGVDLVSSIKANDPDIVIVDINMPGLNGLDALDLVRKQYPEMKVILHSAYSEFEYAKHALALGAFDYIVKPVQKPAFVEMMKKVFAALDMERQTKTSQESIHQLAGEVNRLVENDLMSSILLGNISEHTARLFLQSLAQEYEGGFMVTVRSSGNGVKVWTNQKTDKLIADMNQICVCMGKIYHSELILFLIPGEGVGASNYHEWTEKLFSIGREPFLYGVSSWKYMLDELPDARKECESILLGKTEPGVYFFDDTETMHLHNPFSGEEKRLAGLVLAGKIDECCKEVKGLLEGAAKQGMPLAPMQVYAAYFLLFTYDQTIDWLSFSFYIENQLQTAFKDFLFCSGFEELGEKLCLVLEKLHDLLQSPANKSREYVNKGIFYIRKMYGQNISLEDIARLVGISSFYLSRLLKQELDKSFVEILTEVRITNALKLLPDKSKTIREISEAVGYFNTNYFYKVFKKHVGMTVGEIRRYLRQ
ncbi:response regulator transcription factor [Eubacterium maltosivorans]|uniref:response regulator transcription factor n=1 Tax=Eubacterium maltosivorans TaxID=2041044 RepID=UPI003A9012FE